jgi:hypothetical protein
MATVTLTEQQRANAQVIVDVGRQLGATTEEIIGAIAAAWSESRLDVTAVGDNGQAIGLFQQHYTYGSVEARRDPVTAARQFLQRLIGTRPNSGLEPSIPIGERIYRVQRPAAEYRYRYTENYGLGVDIFQQLATGATYHDPERGLGSSGTGFDASGNPLDRRNQAIADAAAGLPSSLAGDYGPVHGILKSLDTVLNTRKSGIGGLLDPIDDLRVIVARSAVVLAGAVVGVFGLVLIVSSIGRPAVKAAGAVTNPVGTLADLAGK